MFAFHRSCVAKFIAMSACIITPSSWYRIRSIQLSGLDARQAQARRNPFGEIHPPTPRARPTESPPIPS